MSASLYQVNGKHGRKTITITDRNSIFRKFTDRQRAISQGANVGILSSHDSSALAEYFGLAILTALPVN